MSATPEDLTTGLPIARIPKPALIDHLFPYLTGPDLLALSLVCKIPGLSKFPIRDEDEVAIWERKIRQEFPHEGQIESPLRPKRRGKDLYLWLCHDAYKKSSLGDRRLYALIVAGDLEAIKKLSDDERRAVSTWMFTPTAQHDFYKITPFYLAAYNGHLELMQYFLALGHCPELSNACLEAWQGLSYALLNNHLEVARFLIAHTRRIPTNSHMSLISPPVNCAVVANSIGGLRLLFAEYEKRGEDPFSDQENCALSSALRNGCSREVIDLLLEKGARLRDENLSNALIAFMKSEHDAGHDLGLLKILIEKAKIENVRLPLYLALAHGKFDYAEEFVRNGAVPGDWLVTAIQFDNVAATQWILDRSNPQELFAQFNLEIQRDNNAPERRRTPLGFACKRASLAMVRYLSAAGAQPDLLIENDPCSLFELAVRDCNLRLVNEFLAEDQSCSRETSPRLLHRLLAQQFYGDRENIFPTAMRLIDSGVPLDTLDPDTGDTLLHTVMKKPHDGWDSKKRDFLTLLIRRGVSPKTKNVNGEQYTDLVQERDMPGLLKTLKTYEAEYQRFVKAYNSGNTRKMKQFIRNQDGIVMAREAINGKLHGCLQEPHRMAWMQGLLEVNPPLTNGREALNAYQAKLARSTPSQRNKADRMANTDTDDKKLFEAVQNRHPFFSRRSILSRGGKKLVREHRELQTIRMAIEWIKQYVKVLSRKMKSGEKCRAILEALQVGEEQFKDYLDSTDVAGFICTTQGLADALQLPRLRGTKAKGWNEFLETFTCLYEKEPDVQENILG